MISRPRALLEHRSKLAMALILVIALAARLLGIASRPLWYDEAFSVLFSEKGFAAMLIGTLSPTATSAADVHPLTYYSMLWGWMGIFGESPVTVRAFSILAGVVVVLMIYGLARDVFDNRAAVAAALIAALSPFQVHYAQEVRMYVFLALWLLCATYCYWRGSRSTRSGWWLAFAFFAALAQYTHNLAAFYLVALAIYPLLTRDWYAFRRVLVAGILAGVLYIPWLVNLPAQFSKVERSYWVSRPEPYRLLTLLLYFVTNLPLPQWHLLLGLFVAVSVVVIGVFQTVSILRRQPREAARGLWFLYLAFTPPLLLFAFSQLKPVYIERALLPSGAVFCIWLAWTLTATQPPRTVQLGTAALLLLGSLVGIYDHVTYAGFPYAPYSALIASLHARMQPGDVIVHSSKLTMLPSVYADREVAQTYVGDPPGSSVDTLARSTQQVLGLEAQPDIGRAARGAQRVWFLIFDSSNQEYVQAGYPRHPQLTWLMEHYRSIEREQWGDLSLYIFSERRESVMHGPPDFIPFNLLGGRIVTAALDEPLHYHDEHASEWT